MGRRVLQIAATSREGEAHPDNLPSNRKTIRKKKREEKKHRRSRTLNTWTKKKVVNETSLKPNGVNRHSNDSMPNQKSKPRSATFIPHFNEADLKLIDAGGYEDQIHISKTQDDALMEYLDRRMDINGNQQRRQKLEKDIGKELFGHKSGFLGLLDDILDDSSTINNADDTDIPSDESPTDNDEEEEEEKRVSQGIEEDSLSSLDENDELSSGEDESDQPPETKSEMSTGKYVPPSLRKNGSAGTSIIQSNKSKQVEIKTCVKSLFNRVSEANLNLLLQEFMSSVRSGQEKLELSNMGVLSTAEIEQKSKEWISSLCCTIAEEAVAYIDIKSGTNLLAPQTAMVCALSGLISSKIGWLFSARLFTLYYDTSKKLHASEKSDSAITDEAIPVFQLPLDLLNTCRQSITAITLLFYFGLFSATLLTAFFHILLQDGEFVMNVRRAEFLSIILRLAGPTLKQEYPDHFLEMKDEITTLLQEATAKGESHAHVGYLQHELDNINKLIHTPMYEKLLAMRKWLHSSSHSNPFAAVNWDLIQIDIPHGDGKDVVMDLMHDRLPQNANGANPDLSHLVRSRSSASSQLDTLLEKARILGIKTPLQQQAFVAVMGADSVESGVLRVLRTCQKKKQMPLVVSVIFHCAIHEREYNKFYEQLLISLCENSDKRASSRFKTGIRQALHAEVNSLLHDYEGPSKKHEHRKCIVSKLIEAFCERECIPNANSLLRKLEGDDIDDD